MYAFFTEYINNMIVNKHLIGTYNKKMKTSISFFLINY